jgi:hypothetical protein
MLGDRLPLGVGVDYEHSYVIEARRCVGASHLHFVTGDATAVPIQASFDFATMCDEHLGHHERQSTRLKRDAVPGAETPDASPVRLFGSVGTPEPGMVPPAGTSYGE